MNKIVSNTGEREERPEEDERRIQPEHEYPNFCLSGEQAGELVEERRKGDALLCMALRGANGEQKAVMNEVTDGLKGARGEVVRGAGRQQEVSEGQKR